MTPHLDKPAPIAPERPIKRVQFYGRNREPFLCRDGEVLVSGPAGTGKTMTLLTKMFLAAEKYPGMRGLICRKIRESLNEAALVTWETKVLPTGHSALNGPSRRIRQSYKFGNGSEIIIGGLDKSQKLMSTEYDMCFVGETKALSPSRTERGYVRSYSGDLVTLTTAAGNKLTGTPNHPILTPHGWVGLGSLRKGGYVFSRFAGKPLPPHSEPHIAHHPTAISQVVASLMEAGGGSGVTERIETVPMDFHGDGSYGYVDVVTPFGFLQNRFHAKAGQPVSNLHGARAQFEHSLFMGFGSRSQSKIACSSATVRDADSFTKLPHAFAVGLGSPPSLRSAVPGSRKVTLPYGVDSHSLLAVSEDLCGGFPFDASGGHREFKPANADVYGLGYLHEPPLSSEIFLDRIIDVSVANLGGCRHVYNLQTEASWYYASNIIVHNCYVQEAIELTENDWENLTTRLRNGVMPYQQLLADTNPDRPTHWLKRRCDAGKTKLIESRHEDNPSVIDPKTDQPTAAGRVYLGKLDALTGPRKARLRYGRWVQSEGVVYEGYDPAVHVIPKVEIKTEWKRYLSIDFGYTNPFSCLWLAEDPDGRLYVYREIYRTQTLVQDHAREILKQSGAWNAREFRPDWTLKGAEPRPLRVISDHDAEDRATLEKYLGIKVTPADKAVSPGIQAVTARLKPAGDGKPRLFFLADSLCHRPDSNLVEAKKPTRLAEEFDGYIWNPSGKEEPVKVDDHACDALRYAVVAVDGRPIPFTAANVSVGEPIQGTTRRAPQGRIIVEADDEPDSLFERMQS